MGPAFERKLKPDFLAGIRKKWDDYSSLHRHLMGQDPGGMPPTRAMYGGHFRYDGTGILFFEHVLGR